MKNKKVRAVGYKILFTTPLNNGQIEVYIDDFLKVVDSKIAQVIEMSKKELNEEICAGLKKNSSTKIKL